MVVVSTCKTACIKIWRCLNAFLCLFTYSLPLSVLRTLRKLFKVDPADYMISICGNDALRELSSPGKSGSFFYLTNDDRYMIKTMKKSEVKVSFHVYLLVVPEMNSARNLSCYLGFMVKVLLRMLSAYYNHVRAFENTLVTKFYGLHCVKLMGQPIQKKVESAFLNFIRNHLIQEVFSSSVEAVSFLSLQARWIDHY